MLSVGFLLSCAEVRMCFEKVSSLHNRKRVMQRWKISSFSFVRFNNNLNLPRGNKCVAIFLFIWRSGQGRCCGKRRARGLRICVFFATAAVVWGRGRALFGFGVSRRHGWWLWAWKRVVFWAHWENKTGVGVSQYLSQDSGRRKLTSWRDHVQRNYSGRPSDLAGLLFLATASRSASH
jgi:hypothetical protein